MSKPKFMIVPVKHKGAGRRRGHQGGSFFGDVGDFFTKSIPSAANVVYNGAVKPVANLAYNEVRKLKPSEIAGFIPHPYAQAASKGLKKLGAGKRRKRGRGLFSAVKKLGSNIGSSVAKSYTAAHGGGVRRRRVAHAPRTGIIQQPAGTGFNTAPLSLNGGIGLHGGSRRIR